MANEIVEFGRNYENCFFRYKLKSSGLPRAFLMCHYDMGYYCGVSMTSQLSEKSCKFAAEEFLKTNDPLVGSTGFINCTFDRPTALLLQVNPDRQYRKALSTEGNCSATVLRTGSLELDDFIHKKTWDSDGVRLATTEQFLLRAVAHQLAIGGTSYRGFRSALDAIETGAAHSLAISRTFALSLDRNYANPVLWHKGTRQGVVINGDLYVTGEVMPFADFFMKRFDVKMKPLESAP